MMKEELRYTKYAAELSLIDLGRNVVFKLLKQYKYRGEHKEKLQEIYAPNFLQIGINPINDDVTSVNIRGDKNKNRSYPYTWSYLDINTKVAVYDLVEE